MRRQADARTDLDPPETPLSGDIAACSLAVTHTERQNSKFSTWAAMYKNTAQPTVRRTVAGDRYATNNVLSS